MKDIAQRHHGNFNIIKKEKETESVLYIPIGKEHFENDTNVLFYEKQPSAQEEELVIPVYPKTEEEENKESNTPKNKLKILIVD